MENIFFIRFALIIKSMIHSYNNHFVKTQIKSYLQSCIGDRPALMHPKGYVMTEARNNSLRFNVVS